MVDWVELAVSGVGGLRPYQPGKPAEILERELGIRNAIKLASNENPLGPSPRARVAIDAAMANLHLYPDGSGYHLKAALARRHGVEPEQITLGNGSNEVLEMVARAWLGPERNAVYSRHAFAVYALVTQAVAAEARVVPALPTDAAQPYGHDLDAMAARIDGDTRVVFIANPNNPTGTWLTTDALRRFLAQVPVETLVVVDEAYAEYVEDPEYPDATQWVAEFPNLIVTRTFSKIFGLAALRLGYAVSQSGVAQVLNRIREPFNVNSLALAGGLAALEDHDHIAASIAANRSGLAQLRAGLDALGLRALPSVGNFLCFHCGDGVDAAVVDAALQREGVIVRPVGNYELPGFLRVTVGSEGENERFLAALARVLAR
jgi:histidinol-phosphate aminotransferase